jgi:hypothetical protein
LTSGVETRPQPVIELREPDALADVDLDAALAPGRTVVRIAGRCRLSPDAAFETLGVVRLLREATANGLPVSWHADVDGRFDVSPLFHLPPPETATDEASLDAWRLRHRPGLCYYRVGPDFVSIKDVRCADAAARFRLGAVAEFRALEPIVRVESLDAAAGALLEDLERERLVLRLGGFATLLPSRMRRWPVPAREV